MKRIELTIFSAGGLQMLQKCGIRPDDEKYIPLYREYTEMLERGEKVTYIQDCLAKKYGVCPRTVYDIYSRLNEGVSVI
jgi:hypothetical protein